jgi:hypothetical protein
MADQRREMPGDHSSSWKPRAASAKDGGECAGTRAAQKKTPAEAGVESVVLCSAPDQNVIDQLLM